MHPHSLQIYKANMHPINIHWSKIITTNHISDNAKYIKSFKSVQWRYHIHPDPSFEILQLDRLREHKNVFKQAPVYGNSFESVREISQR